MKRIQKAAIATVALSALSFAGAAFAADFPVRNAPIPVSPAYNWTGFYVGGHVGGGWGTTETTANVGALINGFLPNAGVGFNLPVGQTQMNGLWVAPRPGTIGSPA